MVTVVMLALVTLAQAPGDPPPAGTGVVGDSAESNFFPKWKSVQNIAQTSEASSSPDSPQAGVVGAQLELPIAQSEEESATEKTNSPPSVEAAEFVVDQGATDGTLVGQVQASDPDPNDRLTFEIVGGNDAGAFDIDVFSGEITVADRRALTSPSFTLLVRVLDEEGLADVATITVAVRDADQQQPDDTARSRESPEES
jgi:hypothetical protein